MLELLKKLVRELQSISNPPAALSAAPANHSLHLPTDAGIDVFRFASDCISKMPRSRFGEQSIEACRGIAVFLTRGVTVAGLTAKCVRRKSAGPFFDRGRTSGQVPILRMLHSGG
jgi:hypothetical protein